MPWQVCTECVCKYTCIHTCARHMPMAQDAITRWHYYIRTHPSIIFVSAVWHSLLGELANSKEVALPLTSLTTFGSCDKELPGDQAVVLEFICRLFVIVSLQRFVVQPKLLY